MIKKGTDDYDEVYAKLMLCEIYNPKLKNAKVLKVESPDIHDYELNIGIEVTRGFGKELSKCFSIGNKNFNQVKDSNEIKKNIKKHYKDFKGIYLNIDNINLLSPSKGYIDASLEFDYIVDAIKKKNDKLKKYAKFGKYYLYIFTSKVLNIHDIEKIIFKIEKINNYNTIFIDCIYKIFIYENNNIVERELSNKQLEKLNRMTSHYQE